MNTIRLGCVMVVVVASQVVAAGRQEPYPAMAPIGQYLIASQAEIALARSAAPASIADNAEVRVLGQHGYETAVKGTNGFVCFVGRSWDVGFENPQFWNPKIRAPQCANATAARSAYPRYFTRTERVLFGASKAELQKREAADWASGALKEPEAGAVCYMMSKGGYLSDSAGGPWHPHVMYIAPRTADAAWGANFPGSPVASDSGSYEHMTIFFVVVPNWSDGTAAPSHQ